MSKVRAATEIFWFGTGLADQSGPRRFGYIRRTSRTRQVSIALSGPAAVTQRAHRVARNGRCRDSSRLPGIAVAGQVQINGRSLDMVCRGGMRAGECGQGGAGFFSQRQSHCRGVACGNLPELQPNRGWMTQRPWSGQVGMMFPDDEWRVRTNHAPADFTTIKHMAHNLLQTAASKDSMRLRRKVAAWDDDFLASLIAR
jgi:hypothetical protein